MGKKPNGDVETFGAGGKPVAERAAVFAASAARPACIVAGILGALILSWLVIFWFFEKPAGEFLSGRLETPVKNERQKRVAQVLSEREAREEELKRFDEEARARREALALRQGFKIGSDGQIVRDEAYERAREKERRKRRVRRFRWGSPADERGRIWNVPPGEGEQALKTALLRVCMAEADGEPQDCVGIWQVLKNIRSRSCYRGFVRRITECEEGGGETMLSVIRRAQPHILAVPTYKLRNARAGWIRNLETDCEMPEGWRRGENRWDSRYGSKICPQTVELVSHLIKDELPPPRPGARLRWLPGRPITWGGRCETKQASCDDRIACSRGLARIPNVKSTLNAFWCRPGAPGCRRDAEPICAALGYGHLAVGKAEKGRVEQPVKTRSGQVAEESAPEASPAGQEPLASTEPTPPAGKTSI